MGKNASPKLGPAGRAVARNVRRVREHSGWTLAQVSERMTQAGRPMGLSALGKIERGERLVAVDDLAALGRALRVSTFRLLVQDRRR